jgi:hypothetical protein
MSKLLGRIMLALLMLPLAAVVYMLVLVVGDEWMSLRSEALFVLADIIGGAFVAVYWITLWRRTVNWTGPRRVNTALLGLLCVLPGLAAGAIATALDDELGVFLGGVTTILLWVAGTVVIWTETGQERTARLKGMAGTDVITCPTCGYNMTGLRQTVCPECGAAYTVDQLLAQQPSRESAELERL